MKSPGFSFSTLSLVLFPCLACAQTLVVKEGTTTGSPVLPNYSSIDFGLTLQGTSIVKSLRLENTGASTLNLTYSATAGFTLTNAPPSIPAGGSQVLQVTMTATEPRWIMAFDPTLTITSNSTTNSPYYSYFSGTVRPSNDHFADSQALGSSSNTTVIGTIDGAFGELAAGEPDLDDDWPAYEDPNLNYDATVWYTWTAPAGATSATVRVTGPEAPTVISVYTGSTLPTLLQKAYNRRTTTSVANRVTFPVVAGTTYPIRVANYSYDYDYEYDGIPPNLDFSLNVTSTSGSPTTAAQHILAGRAQLQLNTDAGITQAFSHFNSAITLSPANQEALFLRAMTRLFQLETEPEFAALLTEFNATRTGSLKGGGSISNPKDIDGDDVFPAGATSGDAINWTINRFLPRLALVRADLALITDNAFRTDMTVTELGADIVVDRGDALALKATLHGVEMLFQFLFTYNLDVPVQGLVQLQKQGNLHAQQTLAAYTSLLTFASSDRRPQFAAALQSMQQEYTNASNFIRTQRTDPTDLLTQPLSEDPFLEEDIRGKLDQASASLSGEVIFNGNRLNLSRLVTTPQSLRSWLPAFRNQSMLSDTLPDPTFDGVLPGNTQEKMNTRIYQLGKLWGTSQYATDMGELLDFLGLDSMPNEDADGDGESNFKEWIFGSQPWDPGTVVWQDLTVNTSVPTQKEIRITFARRMQLEEWKLIVSVSDDLKVWDKTEAQVQMVGTPADNGDGFSETVTYRLTNASALANKKFLRVESVPQ